MKVVGNKVVQGAVELIDVASASQPTDGFGKLYKKTSDASLYWRADSTGSEINLTVVGDSASIVIVSVSQTAHGFIPGNAVYVSGSTFVKAIATDNETTANGIVSAVGDANNFTFANGGVLTLTPLEWSGVVGTSGMIAGASYFLSSTETGKYTTVEPGISQKLLIAKNAVTALITNEKTTTVNRNLALTNNTSGSIYSVYGNQLSGKYELFDKTDTLLEATVFYSGINLRVQSFDTRITATPGTSGSLNIYNSGLVYIENKTGSNVDLSIYRKAI